MKSILNSLKPLKLAQMDKTGDKEWQKHQVVFLDDCGDVLANIKEKYYIVPTCDIWTRYLPTQFHKMTGAVMTCNTSDNKRLDSIMALMKLNLLDINILAGYKNNYCKIENLFSYVGYNYWMEVTAKIVGLAVKLK